MIKLYKSSGLVDGSMIQSLPLTAFGNVKVSQPAPQVGWNFTYNINPEMVTTSYTGSGTITQSNGMAVIKTGVTSGSSASIATKGILRFIPGIGGLIGFSAIFTPGEVGSTQVIGYGGDADGFFFGYNGSSFGILRRSAGVDYWTPKTSWNEDKMDGSGSSGINLDPTKGNVYQIVFQWGYGPIQFFIESPISAGIFILVDTISYANQFTVPPITNPSLPLFAKTTNDGIASDIILQTATAMGLQQGPEDDVLSITNSFSNSKSIVTGIEAAVFSIRNVSTFQSKVNRVPVKLSFISFVAEGNKSIIFRLILNGTLGGTPSWNNINANASVIQTDIAGTSVTGGKTLLTWTGSKASADQFFVPDNVPLYLYPSDTLTFSALSTGGSDVIGALTWTELF